MSQAPPKLLLVDDETGILDSLQILFRGEGYDLRVAQGGKAGITALGEDLPDIVVTDIRMPGVSGIEVLQRARELDATLPVILMTAQASLHSAVQAVNEGAYYYIQKPFANDELLAICRRAAEARQLKVENQQLRSEIERRDRSRKGEPIGGSRPFVEVLDLARTVAPTDSTILVSGESGTGKEVISRWIHDLSNRSDGPFFSINCGALPESLLESELFGHKRGSFTGAVKDKEGLLVAARGGTFFLDEIGEMTPAIQVKLLRALQEREVIPVGATEPVDVDVRIVAATNRDLEEEIRSGRFRSDLYYRLNVIALRMPSLRERVEDIPVLANHFLGSIIADGGEPKRLSEQTLEMLLAHPWPGNVRELHNALERAAVVAKGDEILPEHLPERVREAPIPHLTSSDPPPNPTMEVIEQAYIQWVLKAEGGNKTRAAEVLGIDPSTLYRKLNRYDMEES